jgi:hypothetical protein
MVQGKSGAPEQNPAIGLSERFRAEDREAADNRQLGLVNGRRLQASPNIRSTVLRRFRVPSCFAASQQLAVSNFGCVKLKVSFLSSSFCYAVLYSFVCAAAGNAAMPSASPNAILGVLIASSGDKECGTPLEHAGPIDFEPHVHNTIVGG